MKKLSHYVLTPVYEEDMVVASASVGICRICRETATGMGASGADICKECGDTLKSDNAMLRIAEANPLGGLREFAYAGVNNEGGLCFGTSTQVYNDPDPRLMGVYRAILDHYKSTLS